MRSRYIFVSVTGIIIIFAFSIGYCIGQSMDTKGNIKEVDRTVSMQNIVNKGEFK